MEEKKSDSPDGSTDSGTIRSYKLTRTGIFPMLFSTFCLAAMFVPYFIALGRKHVDPFIPLVSEVGGIPPQSGIFSIFMVSGALVGVPMIALRHSLVVLQNTSGCSRIRWLNNVAFVVGIFALLGMVATASYPVNLMHYNEDWRTSVLIPHFSSSFIMFISTVSYLCLHTIITVHFFRSKKMILAIRLTVILVIMIGLIPMFLGIKPLTEFTKPRYLGTNTALNETISTTSRKLSPTENVGILSEWIILLMVIVYFATFVGENRVLTMNIAFCSRYDSPSPSSVYPLAIQSV